MKSATLKSILKLVLTFLITIPKRSQWKGHPFYYEALITYEKLLEHHPRMIEPLLSVPLWFNKTSGTKFDVLLSKSGYNYVSDLVHSVEIESY